MSKKDNSFKPITMVDIKIVGIDGVKYDEILGWAGNAQDVTIAYSIDGKQRKITVESEAVKIELTTDVSR